MGRVAGDVALALPVPDEPHPFGPVLAHEFSFRREKA
jgi:hypothetical protein